MLARSPATIGRSAATGSTSAYVERSVAETDSPSARRLPSAAYADSRGSIAVARDTVMIECGTIASRKAPE